MVLTNLVTITVLTSGAAAVLYLVRSQVVTLFLGGEAFGTENVATTSLVIGAFALSIPLESLTHLLSRAVFATHNTILPVLASISGLVVTVATVELLVPTQGVVALPLGFTAGQGVKVLILGAAVVVRTRTVRAPIEPAGEPAAPSDPEA